MNNSMCEYFEQFEFLMQHYSELCSIYDEKGKNDQSAMESWFQTTNYLMKQCAQVSTTIDCNKVRASICREIGGGLDPEWFSLLFLSTGYYSDGEMLELFREENGLIVLNNVTCEQLRERVSLDIRVNEGPIREWGETTVDLSEALTEHWRIDCNKTRKLLSQHLKLPYELTDNEICFALINSSQNELKSDPVKVEATEEKNGCMEFDSIANKKKIGKQSVGIIYGEDFAKHELRNVTRPYERKAYRKKIMDNCLVSLISLSEDYLKALFTCLFRQFPKEINAEAKQFSLNDFSRFGSLQEAKEWLIGKKVDELMRGSFEDWIKTLKSFNIQNDFFMASREKIEEVFQRRNVIVHHQGKVSEAYNKRVGKSFRKEIGTDLVVDSEYMEAAGCLLVSFFIQVGLGVWSRCEKESAERFETIVKIIESLSVAKRWNMVQNISLYAMRKFPDEQQLMLQMHYWNSLKFQGKTEWREMMSNNDYESKGPVYCLMGAAIQNDSRTFYELLPRLLDEELISMRQLVIQPMYETMREETPFRFISRQ